jgi:hypothetical protein
VARRILGSRWWAGFTFNGITAYGNGATSLIGGEDLQQLCRQRLDAFREQRGEWCLRTVRETAARSSAQ